ncbi:MAG TPA: NTP transferase domain-containing protein [Pirellulales bacterium]|jgi:bifunctional UDP-N-acetylglucosamine pyrophosphorylase/glucosamine-1-phosphate N-acetyltransferase/UDP-N-acetylglucosamine pyrophosphorylase|nr:NTP transferase domain-containing protein [Pirellulales bacterium]
MTRQTAIVLAAGKGTRMKSDLPKVLVPVCARPMIEYVLDTLEAAGFDRILAVVGYRSDLVRQRLADRRNVTFVEQTQQLGTGHAVMMCREALAERCDQATSEPVLIVAGDSPMLQRDSVAELLDEFRRTRPACLLGTARKENPRGLGRIVRGADGSFNAIVEEKDATSEQRKITEVNMSTYVFNCRDLLMALERLRAENAQGEYYLTDCPGILHRAGRPVAAITVLKPMETLSINTPEELAVVEEAMHTSRAASAPSQHRNP